MKLRDRQFMIEYESIFESDRSELEKITEAFDLLTNHYKSHGENEVELLRAVNDKEKLVEEQMKLGMIDLVRGMYSECHRRATGRSAWDE